MNVDIVAADYLAAWNTRDGSRIAALFAESGTYEGPTTRIAVHPFDLGAIVEALAGLFPDFAFTLVSVTTADSRIVLEWLLRGTNRGAVKAGVDPTGKALHMPGVDILEIEAGKIKRAVRYYDRRGMMEQLGLQTIVEPFHQGKADYGYSLHVSSGNTAVPAIIALTWIMGRNEAERDRVRVHSGQIVGDFLKEPGFIGIVTGFAGERGFTCTAWQDEASLHRALDQHHARAKQDFRTSGLSPSVWTSVWKPHHINRLWVRCRTCDTPNDMTNRLDGECGQCGSDLPPRPTYW